jgi:hypothetical protein
MVAFICINEYNCLAFNGINLCLIEVSMGTSKRSIPLIGELLCCTLASGADRTVLRVVLRMMAETKSEKLRSCCRDALNSARPSTIEAQRFLERVKQFKLWK